MRANLLTQLMADPYCSSACCRTYHAVDFPADEQEKSPGGELEWVAA